MERIAFIGILLSVFLMAGLFIINSMLPTNYIEITDPNTDSNITNSISCKIFKTRTDAQIFFDENGGAAGTYKTLDKDQDGFVCESLPQ